MNKLLVLVVILLSMFQAHSQKNKGVEHFFPKQNNKRVDIQLEYESYNGKPEYKYEYKYNKKGLLTERVQKHWVNNSWLPKMTQKYSYNIEGGVVVCEYVPSAFAEGALDLDLLKRIKKMDKERDTIKVKNGKLIFLSQYRFANTGNTIHRWFFNYTGDKLTRVRDQHYIFKKTEVNGVKVRRWMSTNRVYVVKLKYDELGWLDGVETGYDNKIQSRHLFQRDENKLTVELQSNNWDGYKSSLTYEFMYQGPFLLEGKFKYASDNFYMENYRFKYDNENRLIEFRMTGSSGGQLYKHKYEYEKGIGNASLFDLPTKFLDYIRPTID